MIFIRSSKHNLSETNKDKLRLYQQLRQDYQQMVYFYVNYLWNNNPLSCPNLLPSNICNLITTRTARLRQCAAKQACSMIHAATKKRQKQLFKLKQLQQENKDTKKLQSKINKFPLIKPNCNNVNPELDSRFVNFKESNNHFDLFVNIKNIGNLPVNYTKVSNKWKKQGQIKQAIRLLPNSIILIYEIEKETRTKGKDIGIDQGYLTTASLSNQETTTKNKDGYDLENICEVLSKRKKGSKGFKRTQEHRKNYVNWSINQLNFNNVKKLKLEKLVNLRLSKRVSRRMSHFAYTLIKQKFIRLSEEKGFLFVEQDNKFRSQRCSKCGWTHKVNRKGKTFKCSKCGYCTDADLNAASNHEPELVELPEKVWLQHLNRTTGFYWFEEGVVGYECIVRDVSKY